MKIILMKININNNNNYKENNKILNHNSNFQKKFNIDYNNNFNNNNINLDKPSLNFSPSSPSTYYRRKIENYRPLSTNNHLTKNNIANSFINELNDS